VRNAVDAAHPVIDEAGHHLTISLPDEPILLYADPHRLAQVLSNLLNNAAKYTPAGGRIWLIVERREREVTIAVKDTGLGVPPEMAERIFEMFAQVDRPARGESFQETGAVASLARANGQTGLGIGLTLVRSLVEMHGGKVEVRSEGRNRGSEFIVRLPLEPSPPSPETSTAVREPRLSSVARHRILLVDDNQASLEMLSKLIQMQGYEVRTAKDGLEAVSAAETFRPDAVLMDLGMPNLDGCDAARCIRAEPWGRDMVLVAMTGWGQEEDRRRTKAAGFDHHLVKPVEPSVIEDLLSRLD
jgi:CheY-like chemotaxis protein